MPDFENAMQVAAARACGARHIITRNVSDFRRSPIPALTPRDALDTLFRDPAFAIYRFGPRRSRAFQVVR